MIALILLPVYSEHVIVALGRDTGGAQLVMPGRIGRSGKAGEQGATLAV
jgi:hypothetical protein